MYVEDYMYLCVISEDDNDDRKHTFKIDFQYINNTSMFIKLMYLFRKMRGLIRVQKLTSFILNSF